MSEKREGSQVSKATMDRVTFAALQPLIEQPESIGSGMIRAFGFDDEKVTKEQRDYVKAQLAQAATEIESRLPQATVKSIRKY